jgi:pilus assembly protein CpaB
MTRRIFAIIIAIALAGLGTAGVLFYALSADARARSAIGNPVRVAVAENRIAAGTTGLRIREEKLVRLVTMPSTSVPEDYLSRIPAEYDKQVVTSNIAKGQILLEANFGEASTVTSGLPLPEGKMALTVATEAPEQVAGYVQKGSRVTIFLTYNILKDGKKTEVERTRVLLPRVEVLAVGSYQPAADGARTAAPAGLGTTTRSTGAALMVTVAVSVDESLRLVEGLRTGSLYLGLLTDSVVVDESAGVDNSDAGGSVQPLFPMNR